MFLDSLSRPIVPKQTALRPCITNNNNGNGNGNCPNLTTQTSTSL